MSLVIFRIRSKSNEDRITEIVVGRTTDAIFNVAWILDQSDAVVNYTVTEGLGNVEPGFYGFGQMTKWTTRNYEGVNNG